MFMIDSQSIGPAAEANERASRVRNSLARAVSDEATHVGFDFFAAAILVQETVSAGLQRLENANWVGLPRSEDYDHSGQFRFILDAPTKLELLVAEVGEVEQQDFARLPAQLAPGFFEAGRLA